MRATAIFIILLIMPFSLALAAFPGDAGFINVRSFGAKGDGITDDTKAILKAIAASGKDTGPNFWHDKIIYFPAGTYLVSAPLHKKYKNDRYASGMALMGAGQNKTIIKLKDNADGFGDKNYPASVIFTSSKVIGKNLTGGGKDYLKWGEGNDAYMNYVENLTIDVGQDNPAAVGIDYLANNMGAVRDVTIKAPEGSGAVGLSMTRKWPGPLLIQNVEIQGFDIGIDVAQTEYGVTLDHVRLKGQKEVGLRNRDNVVSANDLSISGAPKKFENQTDKGMIVMARKGVYAGGKLHKPQWSLHAKDAPKTHQEPIENWVRVEKSGNATQAIKAAFASGAATIYFPHGVYKITENITVPHSVKRIVGMHSTITREGRLSSDFRTTKGLFVIKGQGAPLTIEKLAFDNTNKGSQTAVEVVGSRKVILRDIVGAGVKTLERSSSGGEVYLENTCCGTINVHGSKGVWARQLNSEGWSPRITNHGAPIWVLGIKTEGHTTVVKNLKGARTEIIGGLIYVVHMSDDSEKPAFINEGGTLIASFVEEAFNPSSTYKNYVNNNSGVTLIKPEKYPARGVGRSVPNLFAQ